MTATTSNAPTSRLAAVPEALHEAVGGLGAPDQQLVIAFFEREPGGSGQHEIVLQTEASGSMIVLKLDFEGRTWKRVRRKAA